MIRSMAFVTAAAAALTPSIADGFVLDGLDAPVGAIGAEAVTDLVVAVPPPLSTPRPELGPAPEMTAFCAPLSAPANDNPEAIAPGFEPAPAAALSGALVLSGRSGDDFAVSLGAPQTFSASLRWEG